MEISGEIEPAGRTSSRLRLCAALGRVARCLPPIRGKSRLGRKLASRILAGQRAAVLPVLLRDGTWLLLDPRGRTESAAFYHGLLDEDDLAFFRCCVGPGSTALDIGANIGLVSIPLGRHLQDIGGRLYSFEPVANNARRLRSNVHRNKIDRTVTVIECALGEIEEQMEIGRECEGGGETGNAILKTGADGWTEKLDWTTTSVRRLDNLAVELALQRLDLVKIDVEGAEVGVLRGGIQTITRLRPIIYGEFSSGLMPQFGSTFADVGTLLAPLQYRALAFQRRLDLVEVPYAAGRGNAVLCPAEKAGELLRRCAQARAAGTTKVSS